MHYNILIYFFSSFNLLIYINRLHFYFRYLHNATLNFKGAAALVLVGIGVIIGVAICRKRSNTPVIEGPDDFTTPTYVPAQRIEPKIRYSNENRRSQRASLYVEENRKGNHKKR